jgi:heterodisulfide reductase subunit D
VHPRLFNEERCCGHDLLWSGDRANFIRLAKLNVEAIRNAGIETVITSCPECYKTIRFDYEKHGIDLGFNVIHLYEFLETEIDKGAVEFNHLSTKNHIPGFLPPKPAGKFPKFSKKTDPPFISG